MFMIAIIKFSEGEERKKEKEVRKEEGEDSGGLVKGCNIEYLEHRLIE